MEGGEKSALMMQEPKCWPARLHGSQSMAIAAPTGLSTFVTFASSPVPKGLHCRCEHAEADFSKQRRRLVKVEMGERSRRPLRTASQPCEWKQKR